MYSKRSSRCMYYKITGRQQYHAYTSSCSGRMQQEKDEHRHRSPSEKIYARARCTQRDPAWSTWPNMMREKEGQGAVIDRPPRPGAPAMYQINAGHVPMRQCAHAATAAGGRRPGRSLTNVQHRRYEKIRAIAMPVNFR